MSVGIGIKNVSDAVGKIKRDVELVAESIHRILSTMPGERPRNANFGCRIKEALFNPNDFVTATLGAYFVTEAIERLEPRVKIIEVAPVSDTDGKIIIRVVFKLIDNASETFATNVQVQI